MLQPHHQKLILKTKIPNQKLTDDLLLNTFGLKPHTKFMMIGNEEKDFIGDPDPAAASDLIDDMEGER